MGNIRLRIPRSLIHTVDLAVLTLSPLLLHYIASQFFHSPFNHFLAYTEYAATLLDIDDALHLIGYMSKRLHHAFYCICPSLRIIAYVLLYQATSAGCSGL